MITHSFKPSRDHYVIMECLDWIDDASRRRNRDGRSDKDLGDRINSLILMTAVDAFLEGHDIVFDLSVRSPVEGPSVDLGESRSMRRAFRFLFDRGLVISRERLWAEGHELSLTGRQMLATLRQEEGRTPARPLRASEYFATGAQAPDPDRPPERPITLLAERRAHECLSFSQAQMRKAWVDLVGDLVEAAPASSLFEFAPWYDPFRPRFSISFRYLGRTRRDPV